MIVERITTEIEQREAAGVTVREIELSPRLFYRFLSELPIGLPLHSACRGEFMGVPIRKGRGSWCCRSCGAPREESDRCSFCLQPYDRITIDGEIL